MPNSPSPNGAAFVQAIGTNYAGSATSIVVTNTGVATQKGNVIVLLTAFTSDGSTFPQTLSDDAGNTYTNVTNGFAGQTGPQTHIWIAYSAKSLAAGQTITLSGGATGSQLAMAAYEYSGVVAAAVYDNFYGASQGTSTAWSSVKPANLKNITDLMVACVVTNGPNTDTFTVTAPYNARDKVGGSSGTCTMQTGDAFPTSSVSAYAGTVSVSRTIYGSAVGLYSDPCPYQVQRLGANNSTTSGSSVVITNGGAATAIGNHIIVEVVSQKASTTVTDSAGNTYVQAVTSAQGTTLFSAIFYSVTTVSLPNGGTITVNVGASDTGRVAVAYEWANLDSIIVYDQTGGSASVGTGTAISTTVNVAYPFLVIFGAAGTNGPNTDTFSADTLVVDDAAIGNANVTLHGGHLVQTSKVASTTFSATLSTARLWVGAAVGFIAKQNIILRQPSTSNVNAILGSANGTATNPATTAVTTALATKIGSAIIVSIGARNTAILTPTVTDSAGNTYVSLIAGNDANGPTSTCWIFGSFNSKVIAASGTITVTWNGNTTAQAVACLEVVNATLLGVDETPSNGFSGGTASTAINSGNSSNSKHTNDMAIAAFVTDGPNSDTYSAITAGFFGIGIIGNASVSLGTAIDVASATTNTALAYAATDSTARHWAAVIHLIPFAWPRTNTEAVGYVSDSVTRVERLPRLIAEAIAFVGDVGNPNAFFHIISTEALGFVSDTADRMTARFPTASDALGFVSEAVSRVFNQVRTVAEAIGFVSDVATTPGFAGHTRSATDAIAYGGDVAVRGALILPRFIFNTFTGSDVATRIVRSTRTVTDAVAYVSETATKAAQALARLVLDDPQAGNTLVVTGQAETIFPGCDVTLTEARTIAWDIWISQNDPGQVKQATYRLRSGSLAGPIVASSIVNDIGDSVTGHQSNGEWTSTFAGLANTRYVITIQESLGTVNTQIWSDYRHFATPWDRAVKSAQVLARTITDALAFISDNAQRGIPRTVTEAVAIVSDVATRAAMVFTRTRTEAVGIVSDLASKGAQLLSRPVLESTDYSDNFAVATHTDVVFQSIGTDATGTLNAWTLLGSVSIASNVVTFAHDTHMRAGHADWDDVTLTARFVFSTNSTPSVTLRDDAAGTYLYAYIGSAGDRLNINQVLGNVFQQEIGLNGLGLVAGTNYWFQVSVLGNVLTAKVFADNAGAMSATQKGSTVTRSDVSIARGRVGIGTLLGGGSASTTFGGAFPAVLRVTGNVAGGGWSFGPGGLGWASCEPAFCLSGALAYTGSVSASVNAPTAIAGSGYWFTNVPTLPNKTYVLRCWVNAPAGGTGNFSITTYNNGVTQIATTNLSYPTAGWVLVTYAYTTPADNTFSQVVLRVNSGGQGYFGLAQILPQQDVATRPFWNWIKSAVDGPAYTAIVKQDNPVGYWRLGEQGLTTFDQTSNHRDGTLSGAVVSTSLASRNLRTLVQASFESAMGPWNGDGSVTGASASWSTAQSWDGTHSVKVTILETSSAAGVYENGLDLPGVVPGQVFVGSAWVYNPQAGSVTLSIKLFWFNASNTIISSSGTVATAIATNSWTRISTLAVAAPATAVRVGVEIMEQPAVTNDIFYFDAVQIEFTSLTPWSLPGTVLTGLLGNDSNAGMDFDGSTGSISIPALGSQPQHSLAVWFKRAAPYNLTATTPALTLDLTGTYIGLTSGGNVIYSMRTLDSVQHLLNGAVIADTLVHQIVATFDGTTMRLYMDGTPAPTLSVTGSAIYTASAAYIGSFGAGSYFAGVVDDAAVYSYALTPAQILNQYNAQLRDRVQTNKGRTAADLIAYISDSAFFTRGYNRVVAEAAPYVADITARLLALTRANTDALPLQGDVAARSAQLVVRSALDALGFVADAAVRNATLRTRAVTDAVPYVSDLVTRLAALFRIVPETTSGTGPNLVANDHAQANSNTNWTQTVFDSVNTLLGWSSFKVSGFTVQINSDALMPIDYTKSYLTSFWAESSTHVVGAHAYFGVWPFDVDGNPIFAAQVMWFANTLTTLAVDLRPGDTTITLTSAANWQNGAVPTYQRKISVWDYIDGTGFAWGPNTYTRHTLDNAWQPGGISGNVITLTVPWVGFGRTIPAGTPVSNGSDGGTYMYSAASNVDVPATWTLYQGVISAGYDTTGTGASNQWRPGTAQAKMLLLLNRDVAGNVTNFTDVILAPFVVVGFSDQANLNKVFAKFITESIAFVSDATSRVLGLATRAVTDALPFVSDVAAKISRLRYTASDTIPYVTDVAPRLYTTPRTATDAVPYGGDTNASNRIFTRSAVDTLAFVSETATFTAIKVKIGVLLIRSMVKGLVIRGRSR